MGIGACRNELSISKGAFITGAYNILTTVQDAQLGMYPPINALN
jgi:hypothetical protein